MKKRILLHPDIFYSGHSGAIAAREAARQLHVLGHEVAVFTHDDPDESVADYPWFKRIAYTGTANYRSARYRESFEQVIRQFKPDSVFFIGGIINTPVVYLDICRERSIRTAFLLLVQDFYCARLHAGLGNGSCTRCLEGSGINAFIHRCADKQARPLLYLLNYQVIRRLVQKRLQKIDFVLGSSDEQLDFYRRVGVRDDHIRKIPLFFDQNRIHQGEATPGVGEATPGVGEATPRPNNYLVIIGQYRHEKGIHLISRIVDRIHDGIIIKLLFFNQAEATRFLTEYPENKKHTDSGKLVIMPGITMTTGAIEIIAGSLGVINPSIWATTTEFVLLEVLGLSKPIIVFDVGIHREVIKNRVNGICVKAGDFKALGDEAGNLACHPVLCASISGEANRLYHTLTDPSSFTNVLTEIFAL